MSQMIEDLNLMAIGDACEHLGFSRKRLDFLVKKKRIPCKLTSAGRIFLKEDLDLFEESRQDKMKHKRNPKE